MAEVLLLNPRGRRKARRKNPSPAQRRARAAFAAAARARAKNPARRRARNPVSLASPYAANPRRRRRARRSNPIGAYRRVARRRSNPINLDGIMSMLQGAAVQGAGAVAMDVAYSYVAKYLPASMQAGPGQVTLGSAVKAVITAVAGKALSKATNGLSMKAAQGALTVQARDIVAGLLPAGTMAGLGYMSPASIANYSPRIGPTRTALGAYVQGGTPLLSAYTQGGGPLLSGGGRARAREGMPIR